MPLDGVLGDIREMPPMRPIRKGESIRLVYPFYMYDKAGGAVENQAYIVDLAVDVSNHEITFKKVGIKKHFKAPVETPDFIVAPSLRALYKLAGGAGSGLPRGLLSCRDPFVYPSGYAMRGHLVAVIFDGEPGDEPAIYLVAGTAGLVKGSCRQGNKPAYKGFNIAVLYVAGPSDSSEPSGCPASLVSISGTRNVRIVVEDPTGKMGGTMELESDSLYCYPVYPPYKARGNKFYPATVMATISPAEHVGLGYGAVFELLVGTIFASTGTSAWDLLSGAKAGYPQTHFIPSPALLSSSPSQRWHDRALTLRAQEVPLLRLELGKRRGSTESIAERACRIVRAQILQSLGPESPLRASRIFELEDAYTGRIVVPREILEKVIDRIEGLGFKGQVWRDLVDGLRGILQEQGGGVELFRWTGQRDSTFDIHVDPKLVAKALANELVVYPLLSQALSDKDVLDGVFRRLAAIRYRRIAIIGEPVADLLVGRAGTASEALYVHAWMNFTPIRLLATMYWALSSIAGSPRQVQGKRRALRDTGLLVLSWGLMAAAFAWKHGGRKRGGGSHWRSILLDRLSSSVGAFAVLAGAHGLAHVAMQAMADSFGISRPDLYMRELARLYLHDHNLLKVRGQPRGTALLIDGALLVSPGPSLTGDLSVAAAMEGLYHAVGKQGFINDIDGLCGELLRAAGLYGDGVCMDVWRRSTRSYQASSQAAPPDLRRVSEYLLGPFGLAGSAMSEAYYPPPETAVRLLETLARERGVHVDEVKAYASQLVKAKLPLCYDACEMCVMSDDCPLISSPVQQHLVSRSGAYLLCHASGR